MGKIRGLGVTIISPKNIGRKMGPKNSGEKEPGRLTRESVAEGHRRKSEGMWYGMGVVKEHFLPKMGLEQV